MFEDLIVDSLPMTETEATAAPIVEDTSSVAFNKNDFVFLPSFLNIVELMQNGNDQVGIGRAVSELWEKFDHAQQVLSELPGIQYTKQEQEAILEQEKQLLDLRTQQLAKHLSSPPIENEATTKES
ncbi:hypothetical protein INT43_001778 [Umbelopsis isabellina]|uniref:Mediator of RNA polymerase II transcription subunit 9 n=1 Tax=Mortierella isabellina TaxID=91625 RepID=A0A8H7PRV2_MORIS|nr:hypothetical protein INT43_001778 [Umbelopsis isabellina]